MKKPDRFERRAKKELATPWELNQPRLAMLFRKEHNAVVRLVKRVVSEGDAYLLRSNIIAALARRAK